MVLNFNKLESPSPIYALCQGLLKLTLWFWRGRFLNFINVFFLFHYYLPLERGMALHLNKLEFISPIVALCQVEICPKFLDIEDFSNLVNAFLLLHNYLPLEKGLAFH